MICNTRNRCGDTTESQKEKRICFNPYFQYTPPKITNNKVVYSSNKMWSLKSLAKLKCESRTSLSAVQYK